MYKFWCGRTFSFLVGGDPEAEVTGSPESSTLSCSRGRRTVRRQLHRSTLPPVREGSMSLHLVKCNKLRIIFKVTSLANKGNAHELISM